MSKRQSTWSIPFSRRHFLMSCGAGVASLALAACTQSGSGTMRAARVTGGTGTPEAVEVFTPDLELVLAATHNSVSILPGAPTQAMTYRAAVLRGDPAAVTELPGSYLGPIIRVRRGQHIRVHLSNGLDEPTNVHWHGLIVPPEADGHPSTVVEPGSERTVDFEIRNRAGTYWFHPHPHGRTAEQVYAGLAGLVIVHDDEEDTLALPHGAQDIALVVQDRKFDGDNQFVYLGGPGMGAVMEAAMGVLGDHILVNGQPDARFAMATRPYRLRVLNGSNARIYKLAWDNGSPVTVIGTDGGLLDAPRDLPYVMLAPSERVEIWADFRGLPLGTEVKLVSLPFTGVEAGMVMGGQLVHMAHAEGALPQGVLFDVATFTVEEDVADELALPDTLTAVETLGAQAVNAGAPRQFRLFMDATGAWTINGRSFEMDAVAEDERVALGSTEIWELINEVDDLLDGPSATPGAGMADAEHSAHGQHIAPTPAQQAAAQHDAHDAHGGAGSISAAAGMAGMRDFMAHPMHVHGVQFQVLGRTVADAQRPAWETVKDGLLDAGWKDTVLVMPGERVQIALRFDAYPGFYLIHCHNLEHEDGGMMRNFEVVG